MTICSSLIPIDWRGWRSTPQPLEIPRRPFGIAQIGRFKHGVKRVADPASQSERRIEPTRSSITLSGHFFRSVRDPQNVGTQAGRARPDYAHIRVMHEDMVQSRL